MSKQLYLAVVVVLCAVTFLVYRGVSDSSRKVVTVTQLVSEGTARRNVRLGARVAPQDVVYRTDPTFSLSFAVVDPGSSVVGNAVMISVVYNGARPDTFKVGRDVILEGDFNGREFHAKVLQTQCPSKYEAPTASRI